MTLWVLCPVYLDVESFTILHGNILGVLGGDASSAGRTARFVVIDDSAGTDPEIRRLSAVPDLTVVTPPFNLGHQRPSSTACARSARASRATTWW